MRYILLSLVGIALVGGLFFGGGKWDNSDMSNKVSSMKKALGDFEDYGVIQVVKQFSDNKNHDEEIKQELLKKSTSVKKDFNQQTVETLMPYLEKNKSLIVSLAHDYYGVTISEQQIDQVLKSLPQNMTVQQLVGLAQNLGIDLQKVFANLDEDKLKEVIKEVYGEQNSKMVFDWYLNEKENNLNQNKF